MSPSRTPSRRVRRPFGAALAFLVAVTPSACAPRSEAEGLAPDPVDALKQALIQGKPSRDKRQGRVEAAAEQLQSLGDMSRALLLTDWSPDRNADELAIRKSIADRFGRKVQETARQGDAGQQAAVANLVGETAVSVRAGLADQGLRRTLSGLADVLISLTESQDPTVRQAAARALGNVDPDPHKAARALEKLLPASDTATRVAAATALGSLLADPRGYARDPRGPAAERMRGEALGGDSLEIGRAVAPVAIAGLDGSQPVQVRRLCADACGEITAVLNKRLIELPTRIESAIDDEGRSADEGTRRGGEERDRISGQWESVRSILEVFDRQAPSLARAAVDPDPAVRIQVRRVLEELAVAGRRSQQVRERVPAPRPDNPAPAEPDKKTPPKPAPKDKGGESGKEVKKVGQLLTEPPVVSPVPAVLVALQGEREAPKREPDVRDRALSETLKAAVEGLSDPNVRGRLSAVDLLETMGPDAAPAIPALVARLGDDDRFVRWSAVRTLGRLAPRQAALVVPALAASLQNADLDVRLATAAALERYGPEARAAVVPLGLQVMKGDAEIRIAVMRSLEAIGSEAAPALPAIARNLESDNPRIRAAAANSLGRFGKLAARGAPWLRLHLTDPDPDVRRAASEALLKVTGG